MLAHQSAILSTNGHTFTYLLNTSLSDDSAAVRLSISHSLTVTILPYIAPSTGFAAISLLLGVM